MIIMVISFVLLFLPIASAQTVCTGNGDSADLTCGLVGWWQFDDVSGTSAVDSSSGNVNTGTLYNSPVWTKGILNEGALSFNGTNNYVLTGTTNIPMPFAPVSVSAWVKLASTPTADSAIVYRGGYYEGNPAPPVFYLSLTGANHNQPSFTAVQHYAGGSTWVATSTVQLVVGQWYHLVGVSLGTGGMSLYVNGVLTAGSMLNFSDAIDTYFPLSIGAKIDNTSSGYFAGLIDDVRIYNRDITQADVTSLYDQGIAVAPSIVNLSIIELGVGQGTVTAQGINCPSTCSEAIPHQTSITLTATPAAGSQFAGWSGGGCSGTGSCTVVLTQDINVSAVFIPSGPSSINNIYVSQNGGGNGSSCSDAMSVAWLNTTSSWGSSFGQITPGSTVLLCGLISTPINVLGSGSLGNPITILFGPNAQMTAPTWPSAWAGVGGAIFLSKVSYVVIDGGTNGVIQATQSGSNLQPGSVGITLAETSNIEVKNLSINNMYVRTSSTDTAAGGVGINVVGGSNINVHNNIISQGMTGIGVEYLSNQTMSHIKLYANTFSGNNWGIGFGEQDVNALADDIQIYSNNITGSGSEWDEPGDTYHHNGIYAFAEASGDSVTNLKVYNNYVHGDFGVNVTAMIFTSGLVYNPIYYNNVMVYTGSGYVSNGFIRAGGVSSKIYNNTFIDHFTSMAMDVQSGTDVKNNLIYNTGNGVCIHWPTGQTTFDSTTMSDNNVLYSSNGLQMVAFDDNGDGNFYTVAQWQNNFNLDIHSITSNPLLVNPAILSGNYNLQATSPAIGAGVNLSQYFTTDANGNTRPSTGAWDIGAYAYVTVPASGNVLYGDVTGTDQLDSNGNPIVTMADADLTAQAAVGSQILSSIQQQNAQVDGTGRVNIYDAYLIAQRAASLITQFPAQSG